MSFEVYDHPFSELCAGRSDEPCYTLDGQLFNYYDNHD